MQHVRRYATEPSKSSSSNIFLYSAAAAAIGVGGYYYFGGNPQKAADEAKKLAGAATNEAKKQVPGAAPPKTFTGGDQGFVSLVLEDVEKLNHNTKKFRFALPDEGVSGLQVACKLLEPFRHSLIYC